MKIPLIFFLIITVVASGYQDGTKLPQFPGGDKEKNKFIASVFKYPESSRYKGINDTCVLNFFVNTDGSISNVTFHKTVKGCEACDIETLRILRLMPRWEPGQAGNRAVRMAASIAIPFNYLK